MTGGTIALVLATFLAAAVEVVEALTIVLAVGVTREWRSTLIGVISALLVLAAMIALLGPALASLAIDVLRVVVLAGSVSLISLLKEMEPRVRTAPDQARSGSV